MGSIPLPVVNCQLRYRSFKMAKHFLGERVAAIHDADNGLSPSPPVKTLICDSRSPEEVAADCAEYNNVYQGRMLQRIAEKSSESSSQSDPSGNPLSASEEDDDDNIILWGAGIGAAVGMLGGPLGAGIGFAVGSIVGVVGYGVKCLWDAGVAIKDDIDKKRW